MMRRRIALACLSLSGCTLLEREPAAPLETFVLRVDPPAAAAPSATGKTLVVSPPAAAAGFDSARMAYALKPHAVSYYAHHQWADTPARMLLPAIIAAMERSGCWAYAVDATWPVDGSHRLETESLVLLQEFLGRPSRVRLSLRAVLIDLETARPVASRRFEEIEPAATEDAIGGVEAAHEAVRRLVEEMAGWVGEQLDCGRSPESSG